MISTIESTGQITTTSNALRTSLAVVNGRPAVCYHHINDDSLKFAINANADGSGAWTFSVVDAIGDSPSLAVVGGKPAISYSGGYAINTNADGSGAWEKTSDPLGTHNSLLEVSGAPGISAGGQFFYPNSNLGTFEIDWPAIGR